MTLARLMVITDRNMMSPSFSQALHAALLGGARLIQLREKGLPAGGVLALARTAQEICLHSQARLLINSDYEITREVGAFGTHLREAQSLHTARKIVAQEYCLGQSVHSLESAIVAQNSGADYLVFGSIFPTASHAGSTPVGVEALRELVREISIPIFAVGGISNENARQCLDAGAYGVAVMRAVWEAPDIEMAVRQLNDVLHQ